MVQLYEGGPGEQAGLKTGDVIKAVDGTDVTEKETSDIASMVRDSEKDSRNADHTERKRRENPGYQSGNPGCGDPDCFP